MRTSFCQTYKHWYKCREGDPEKQHECRFYAKGKEWCRWCYDPSLGDVDDECRSHSARQWVRMSDEIIAMGLKPETVEESVSRALDTFAVDALIKEGTIENGLLSHFLIEIATAALLKDKSAVYKAIESFVRADARLATRVVTWIKDDSERNRVIRLVSRALSSFDIDHANRWADEQLYERDRISAYYGIMDHMNETEPGQ